MEPTLETRQAPKLSNGIVATNHLREKIREYAIAKRNSLRADARDALRFGLGEIKEEIRQLSSLNESDVIGLVSRIKRRKNATAEDMYRLSHAFLQSNENIAAFNKIPGAIQVLIKAFTGSEIQSQLSAAECLCNLSLGEAAVCEKISTFAGSYLVTYLHSNESQIVRLCLWTLANILATDSRQKKMAVECILQMQLLPQLWKFYVNDELVADPSQDYREDAAICLGLIAERHSQLLSANDRDFVIQHATEKSTKSVAGDQHLLILFNILFLDEQIVSQFPMKLVEYLINFAVFQIYGIGNEKQSTCTPLMDCLIVIYAIRVLGNLAQCHSVNFSELLGQCLHHQQSNISKFLLRLVELHYKAALLSTKDDEFIWFLKNLRNSHPREKLETMEMDGSSMKEILTLI